MYLNKILATLLIAATPLLFANNTIVPIEADLPFEPEGDPLEGLIITIDPGHGGSSYAPGYSGSARGINSGVVEGDLNMKVAVLLRHHLRRAGADVRLTRLDDRRVTLNPESGEPTGRDQELGARVQRALDTESHLFLSLHHNSASRSTADGVVILIWPEDGDGNEQPLEIAFADILEETLREYVPNKEEFGHYIKDHPLVNHPSLPSAVVEFGFLSNPDFDAWVSQPGSHRTEAKAVYHAIVDMWTQHKEDLEEQRLANFPDAKPIGKVEARDWSGGRFDRLARQLWPSDTLPETVDELNQLLSLYRYTRINDRTIFLLDTKVEETEDGELHLTVSSNHKRVLNAPEQLLEAVGKPADNITKRLLPDSERLDNKEFGVIQIPMALTWGYPREGAVVQTQVLLGEPVYLLDKSEDGDYYRIHAANGYIGWVRRDAVKPMGREAYSQWINRPVVRVKSDTMINDFRVPTGALLPYIDRSGSEVLVELPRGVRATNGETQTNLPSENVVLPSEMTPGRLAAESAKQFLWSPYVFGGRSSQGIDCSGFVALSYHAVGLEMPRDAFQQVLVGQMVATPWHTEDLQAGDTLFFLDSTGRVSHTGISLGGDRFIHAAPPMVHVSSFDPEDELYSERTIDSFAFGRRPLVP